MLRILQVGAFPFPAPWGSQVYAAGMVRALARRGHRVVLVTYGAGQGTVPPEVDVVRIPRLPGVEPFLGSGPHWSRAPNDLLLRRALRRLLARGRFDVVHAHNVEATVIARSVGARPLVYGMHARMEEELGSWFASGKLLSRLGRALDRAAARADASVAISEAGREALIALGARRVALVEPGIDLEELEGGDAARARQRWELGDRDWVVYTGNTDAYQDLPVLLDAVARVPEAGLLVVTGGDADGLRQAALAAGIGSDRLRVVASRDFADAKDALAAGALAASPRTRCAGFPIKLLNTLGSGLPTVCAEGSARPIAGVLRVPDGDAPSMAAAIAGLLAGPDRRRALGEAARADVAARWTWAVRAAAIEEFYEATIADVTRDNLRA